MALVRQLTTAGFRPISKYEYIAPWLSLCAKSFEVPEIKVHCGMD